MKFFTFLCCLLPWCATAQNRIYVNATATGQNNGTTWSDAYNNLSTALQNAQSGDAVWVAQGTYFPTNTTDRTVSFQHKSGVKMYGGFTGTETTLDTRDWNAFPTILSGDIGVLGDSTDNSHTVVYMSYPDSTTVLDGFTISSAWKWARCTARSAHAWTWWK